MTASASASATAAYVPPGHPVRRFVLALFVVGAVAGAVGWSGVVGTRLTVETESVSWDGATRAGEFVLHIANRAPTAVELEHMDLQFPLATLDPVDLAGRRVEGGESTRVVVGFTSACTAGPRLYEPVRITVRTAVGLHRTTTLHGALQMGPFPCPG